MGASKLDNLLKKRQFLKHRLSKKRLLKVSFIEFVIFDYQILILFHSFFF